MTDKEFEGLLLSIVTRCVQLKNKYAKEKDLKADWICVFAQSEAEYSGLLKHAGSWGHIVNDLPSGPVFRFDKTLQTKAGIPNVLKIRKPDPTKPELGDVDFTTDYNNFKKKYFIDKRFGLIVRDKFEMLELKDKEFDVICYFSSIPPSKLVN
jgi:hypothetical protein